MPVILRGGRFGPVLDYRRSWMDAFAEGLQWLTADGGPDDLRKHDNAAIVSGPESPFQTHGTAAAGRYHDLALDSA